MGNIYLVGFMGTGKTFVGKELTRRIKRQFVDLDDLIELKEKRAIRDIFVKKGEPYFRKIEKKALREISKEDNFVIACGGGIVMDEENIKTMKNTGIIVCLTASADTILKRTSGYAHRPLLNVSDPKKQIGLLLKLRAPYYALADKTIDTTELSVKKVVDRVIRIARKNTQRR